VTFETERKSPAPGSVKVPAGRLGRLARLAAAGVRSGAGMLLERDGSSGAKAAADALGTLRGLAAKVGQMASYVDGLVPEAQREAYEASMKALRAQAPRSSAAEIRAMVEEELAGPIDRLFADWDDAPVASASIGQVHRARLHDGLEVAVKVQHPGIVRAVESDLANAGMVEHLVGAFGGKRFDTRAMLRVVRERFREELDYVLEASRLSAFAELHAGDPAVRIPALVEGHSTRRVLTTAFARGLGFDDACLAPEASRRAWAEAMWRFVFKGTLVGGMLAADPHPGNYVFHEGGVVTFLDFGCVQPMGGTRRERAVRLHRAAIERDEEAFKLAVSAMIETVPGRLEDSARAYTRLCFAPLFESPYRITRRYAASLVEDMKTMALLARKIDKKEFFTLPSDMVFSNRLQFGFYSVLARFDVEVDYARVEAAFAPVLD
jgi:predicted unusual protein kinase regulating ubiquinone biosynthesis (AarF/ABC1/UbiB family)